MGLPTKEWKARGTFSEVDSGGNPEAKVRKHVPVVTVEGSKAKIAVNHGMAPDHWIQAVWIEADGKPVAEHVFAPTDMPEVELDIPTDATEITAFSMCNLHDVYTSPATPIGARDVRLIAFGSCRKQSLPAPIWDAVLSLRPDAWLWTGDAVYPRGNASPEELRGAYRKVAADDSRVRSAVRVYDGVYDDHDFGLNDAGSAFVGREASRQAFLDEIVRAPADSVRRTQPGGLYGSRTLGRPPRQVKLIMLDTRFSRDDHAIPSVGGLSWLPKPGYAAAAVRLASAAFGIGSAHDGDVLGSEQWSWLRTELTNSSAAVHIIVSSIQVLTTSPVVESWGHFPASRRRLLELLREARPAGALLVSGDVHYAEMLGAAAAPAGILEFTSSGLNRSCGSKGGLPRLLCQTFLRIWHAHRQPHDGVSGPAGAATPLGGASVELNFGSIGIDWPATDGQGLDRSGGSLIIQAHGVDGTPLLRHQLPLGLGGQLEAQRWQAALDMPTIFDEALWLRGPVVSGILLVAAAFCILCGCLRRRHRAPPTKVRDKAA